MPNHTCVFFATHNDLTVFLNDINRRHAIEIFTADWYDAPKVEKIADYNNIIFGKIYLIASAGKMIEPRSIAQRNGSVKYSVDQMYNPDTIALDPGGMSSDHRLVAGQFGAYDQNAASLMIYRIALDCIEKSFSKVKAYRVGPEAQILLDKGFRLSRTIKSPPSYDLSRD